MSACRVCGQQFPDSSLVWDEDDTQWCVGCIDKWEIKFFEDWGTGQPHMSKQLTESAESSQLVEAIRQADLAQGGDMVIDVWIVDSQSFEMPAVCDNEGWADRLLKEFGGTKSKSRMRRVDFEQLPDM